MERPQRREPLGQAGRIATKRRREMLDEVHLVHVATRDRLAHGVDGCRVLCGRPRLLPDPIEKSAAFRNNLQLRPDADCSWRQRARLRRRRLATAAQRARKPVPKIDVGDDPLRAAAEEPMRPQRGLDFRERADLDHRAPTLPPPLSRAASRRTCSPRHDHRERDRHDDSSDGEREEDRAHVEGLEQPAEGEHRHGPEIVMSVITAVITFGRSSAGARVVRIAINGAVATAPRPAANITAITPIAGNSRPSRSSGAETQRMPAVASRIAGHSP